MGKKKHNQDADERKPSTAARELLRSLPSMSALLEHEEVVDWLNGVPRSTVVAALQSTLDLTRGDILSGDGCRDDCQKIEICPDGELDVGEECDDDNTNPNDTCNNDCFNVSWSRRVVFGLGVGEGVPLDTPLGSPLGPPTFGPSR